MSSKSKRKREASLDIDETEAMRFFEDVVIPDLMDVIANPASMRYLFNASVALSCFEGNRGFVWKTGSPLAVKLLPVLRDAISRVESLPELSADQSQELQTLIRYLQELSHSEPG